ncbi:MAG: hypothetical protein QME59_03355, partial [Candidatus Hydrothermarchaeota archaeon]|nr:hypothetical protein [Candidatus Hydrothermarchaeota archaeon]
MEIGSAILEMKIKPRIKPINKEVCKSLFFTNSWTYIRNRGINIKIVFEATGYTKYSALNSTKRRARIG